MSSQENASPRVVRRLHWYNSLIARVIALCAVLVLCLMGSVYFLTGHYYRQVVSLMESQALEVADQLELWVEVRQDEGIDFSDLPANLQELRDGGSLELEVADEPGAGGSRISEEDYVSIFFHSIPLDDEHYLEATVRISVDPQTAIVRTFKNRYLAALSLGFFLALGLMIYLIVMTLRPLRELSESCAQISAGNLRNVRVRGTSNEIVSLEETFNGMVSSLRDKQIVEANLRQAQRLSAIGNLAAGVAHDVRNPLNAIKLLSSHAVDSIGEHPEMETASRQLRTIRNEVNRLEEIVSSFLSLAKEEELHPELQPIDGLLEECVRLVTNDAKAREVRFMSELRSGDTNLMLDKKHWNRAMINVLLNALQACVKGGRVRLFSRVTDETCEIEVRDDGPGMSKEVIERAFDPYFTTKDTGTGLGLSITRGIIEEHGGAIVLSSVEGQGCQVLITMPLSTQSTSGEDALLVRKA